MPTSLWTKDQVKLAFHLYCQLPFGKLDQKNPEVIELAQLIGRTPSAVAMRLVNIASLDPAVVARGRVGLTNASALDRELWVEFHKDWEGLAIQSQKLRERLEVESGFTVKRAPDIETELPQDFTGETRQTTVEQRIKQGFFRRMVLSSYDGRCCMSGLTESRLLVASHIVPWGKDKLNRLNPCNGLCLSAIHDRAFDRALITVTPELKIQVSPLLQKHSGNSLVATSLLPLHGKSIQAPWRFSPSEEFLRLHNMDFERLAMQD